MPMIEAKETKWISIKDKRPEYDQDVLVYDSDSEYQPIRIATYDECCHWCEEPNHFSYYEQDWEGWHDLGKTQYWMPLPKLPKETK